MARRDGLRGSPHARRIIAQVVLEQLGVPASWPAGAVGVVAVGQAHGRAVAGDVAGIAFNAQAVTVVAQIVAAEVSGRADGGPAVAGPSDHPAGLLKLVGGNGGVSVAGILPALRARRTAGGPGRVAPVGRSRAGAAA